jgi:hypothetical protein
MTFREPPFLVGDRVWLHHVNTVDIARVTALHRAGAGWEVVVVTDGRPDAPGRIVNVFTATGRGGHLSAGAPEQRSVGTR